MDIGFDTIGNATLIAYDRGPVLATDPWVRDSAYFGSWMLSHQVPPEQMEAVLGCPYVWFSHGHPDHLNGNCLDLFKDRTILLPDHSGQRIRGELGAAGFDVKVLPDRTWVPLSDRIRVLCIPDYSQNAILLVDVGGRLLVNLNDGIDRGWGRFVRREVKRFETSILLALTGYGDADMINYHGEDGRFLEPPAGKRFPVGRAVAQKTESFGCRYFVPFSSMHKYQRSDSVWANRYATPIEDQYVGFSSDRCEMLPAYVRYDCSDDSYAPIEPPENPSRVVDPAEFGDDWNETLSSEDVGAVERYFRAFQQLGRFLDFVCVRVGGRDHFVGYRTRKFDRGVTFEVPRGSLMQAIEYEVFDDLLIGNFMKTTLHGRWPESKLYPNFTPPVTKYGDNGRAHTREQLRAYFRDYLKRAPLEYLRHSLELKATNAVRSTTPHDSETYLRLKRAYWTVKAYV